METGERATAAGEPAAAAMEEDGEAEAAAAMEEDPDDPYVLGFAEPPEDARALRRHRFPSKLGGRPAWLDPCATPGGAAARCGHCGGGLRFLLQLYCPVGDAPHAFHRALFVFVCPRGACAGRPGAARAFRSQMARANPFYPPEPAGPDDHEPPPPPRGEDGGGGGWDPGAWPEWELVDEDEPEEGEGAAAAGGRPLPKVEIGPVETEDGEDGGDGAEGAVDEAMFAEASGERAQWEEFQARVGRAPDQCLRYKFGGGAAPLWPALQGRPEPADVPACPRCGAARAFELQVMPQCLHYLGVDDTARDALDFATVAVFSCAANCDFGLGYAEEVAWVQASADGPVDLSGLRDGG